MVARTGGAAYRRVAQADNPEGGDEVKKQRAERIDRITAKLHALLWVGLSIALLVYTNLLKVAYSDARVNRCVHAFLRRPFPSSTVSLPCLDAAHFPLTRYSLSLAVVCFVANMGIVLYLTLWLPLVLKVTVPWDIYCPHLIPISTVLGLLVVFLLVVAFYPIYGMLTPLIMGILLMGFLFSTHFIPWPV